jgi:hypothetical protein
MSERINVDHAFDPEARQAQADLDAYMNSRAYEDSEGLARSADDGSLIDNDQYRLGDNDTHYEDTLADSEMSGASLDQLAKRVAEARKDGDKTRATDAEEAFMDKFYEYAEKYGWEEPNVDETASMDRQSEVLEGSVGRDTIDARLERYGKIMYGETESSAPQTTEETPAESNAEASLLPNLTEEQIDTRLAAVERVKAEMAQDDEPEHDSEAQQERMQERLESEPLVAEGLEDIVVEAEPLSADGLDPLEVPVQDGESLEDYERRTGVDTEPLDAAGLEDIEGEEPEARQSRRLRDRFSPTALAARLTTAKFFRNKNKEASRDSEDSSKERSRKKLALGLGVLSVAAVGVGVILANKYGVDYQPGNGNRNGGGGGGGGGGGNRLNWNDFDSSARNVTNGEGWNQTFKEMGIPKSEWNDVLKSAGPKLAKLNEAYFDNNAGEWRISRPGQLSNDALRVIASSSRKNGVQL